MKFLKLLIATVPLLSFCSYGTDISNSESIFLSGDSRYLSKSGTLERTIETDNISEFHRIYCDSDYYEWIDFYKECNAFFYPPKLRSPLDVAAYFNATDIFEYLLENACRPTIDTMNLSAMTRRNNLEIFQLCKQKGVTPDNNTINFAFNNLDMDLFVYICQEFPQQYTFNSRILDEYPLQHRLIYSYNQLCYQLSLEETKNVFKQFKNVYPGVFESFPESSFDNIFKIAYGIGTYIDLAPYVSTIKTNLPIFEKYSQQFFPTDISEDAVMKTMGNIVSKKGLAFEEILKEISKVFEEEDDKGLGFVAKYLKLKYDYINEFGPMYLFDIIQDLEREYFYVKCFEKTSKLCPGFWQDWIEKNQKRYICSEYIANKMEESQRS